MKFHCGPDWDERVLSLKPKKKVGVLVSSGMDSTVLLYLLAKSLFKPPEIKLYNIQTGPNKEKPVIIELLKQMGLSHLKLNIVGQDNWSIPMYNHHARIWLAMDEIRQSNEVEELYCGNIQSPRNEFFHKYDPNSPEFPKRPWRTNDPFLKNPMEHLEKYHIIDLARRRYFDKIFKTTISCNRHELWHCGECMGCKEMKWGYEQLDNEEGTSLDDLVEQAKYDLTHDETKDHDRWYWNKDDQSKI